MLHLIEPVKNDHESPCGIEGFKELEMVAPRPVLARKHLTQQAIDRLIVKHLAERNKHRGSRGWISQGLAPECGCEVGCEGCFTYTVSAHNRDGFSTLIHDPLVDDLAQVLIGICVRRDIVF